MFLTKNFMKYLHLTIKQQCEYSIHYTAHSESLVNESPNFSVSKCFVNDPPSGHAYGIIYYPPLEVAKLFHVKHMKVKLKLVKGEVTWLHILVT